MNASLNHADDAADRLQGRTGFAQLVSSASAFSAESTWKSLSVLTVEENLYSAHVSETQRMLNSFESASET